MNIQWTAYINEPVEKYLLAILTGFSLFFVLFVYQGFGIQAGLSFSGHSHFVRAFAFGGLTSYVFYVSEFRLAGFLSQTSLKSKLLWIAVS